MAPSTHPQHPKSESDHDEQLVVGFPQLEPIGIPFSNCQLLRKEKVGDFPPRWYLSEKKPCWFKRDIVAWLNARAAASYMPPGVVRDEAKWRKSVKERYDKKRDEAKRRKSVKRKKA
jgi:hypothetical protein